MQVTTTITLNSKAIMAIRHHSLTTTTMGEESIAIDRLSVIPDLMRQMKIQLYLLTLLLEYVE